LPFKLVLAAEGTGETLALVTWLLFGAMVIGPAFNVAHGITANPLAKWLGNKENNR
jgi:hypothetical protein